MPTSCLSPSRTPATVGRCQANLLFWNSDAAAFVIDKCATDSLAKAMAGLAEECRSGCALAVMEGFSYEEIAEPTSAPRRSRMAPIDRYTCQETFRRLDDYLDRELTPSEMQLVREHLEICAVCAAEFTFEESVLRQVRAKLERIAAPADLLTKITRAIRQAQGGTGGE